MRAKRMSISLRRPTSEGEGAPEGDERSEWNEGCRLQSATFAFVSRKTSTASSNPSFPGDNSDESRHPQSSSPRSSSLIASSLMHPPLSSALLLPPFIYRSSLNLFPPRNSSPRQACIFILNRFYLCLIWICYRRMFICCEHCERGSVLQ